MNDPILEYRLKQLEERIGDDRFLKNQGSGNEIGFWIFDYPAKQELQVREYLHFLFKKLDKKYTYKTLNIFQVIVDMLEERKLFDRICQREPERLALHDSWIKQLENTTMPTVLLDNFISGNPNVCYLGTDSYEGITMAVNHLVNLGHKNIAFLNGSLYSLVSDQRQEAFESAMAAASLPVQKDLTAYGYYVSDSAKYHVPGFLSAGATAVVCGNDLIAKGVIDECTKRGFRVPEDVSVVGFDDISIAATFDPPLTTIRQERNELGRCAYDILNSLIHHIPISKTLLRPKLIERESTARCAHRD